MLTFATYFFVEIYMYIGLLIMIGKSPTRNPPELFRPCLPTSSTEATNLALPADRMTDTEHEKRKKRQFFRRRVAIVPLIARLKSDCRMERNYLWEEVSSTMNAYLSSAVWNLKKYMERLKKAFLAFFFQPIYAFFIIVTTIICNSSSYSMTGINDRKRVCLAF